MRCQGAMDFRMWSLSQAHRIVTLIRFYGKVDQGVRIKLVWEVGDWITNAVSCGESLGFAIVM